MTSEQFHDVLTLLPADLIAQADELRCRKPKIIPWKRYAALAACLAVLLCAAAVSRNMQSMNITATMSAAAPAAMEDAAPMEDAEARDAAAPRMEAAQGVPETAAPNAMADSGISFTCVETPVNVHTTASFVHGPSATGITSREELDAYLSKWDRLYLLDTLRDACSSYDEDWFAAHDLLLIPLVSVPAGQSCIVTEMTLQDGVCDITIAFTGEETEEITNYHVAVPTEKGAVSDTEQIAVHIS